jgi:hypothetical protein
MLVAFMVRRRELHGSCVWAVLAKVGLREGE